MLEPTVLKRNWRNSDNTCLLIKQYKKEKENLNNEAKRCYEQAEKQLDEERKEFSRLVTKLVKGTLTPEEKIKLVLLM